MGAVASRSSLNLVSKCDHFLPRSTGRDSEVSVAELYTTSSGEETDPSASSASRKSDLRTAKSCSNLYSGQEVYKDRKKSRSSVEKRGEEAVRRKESSTSRSRKPQRPKSPQKETWRGRSDGESSECYCQDTDCSSSPSVMSDGSCSICREELARGKLHRKSSSSVDWIRSRMRALSCFFRPPNAFIWLRR